MNIATNFMSDPSFPSGELFNRDQVISELDKFVKRFPTQEAAAKALDISRVFLWRILNHKKPPSSKVLQRLGFERETKQLEIYYRDEQKAA